MAKSEVLKCVCDHKFQDEKYGRGMRVMNPTGKSDKGDKYKCTVCGNERTGGIVERKEVKKRGKSS